MILLTRHGEDDDSRFEAGIQYTNKEVCFKTANVEIVPIVEYRIDIGEKYIDFCFSSEKQES